MSPRLRFADLHVSLICSDQVKLSEMVTPRYFSDLLPGDRQHGYPQKFGRGEDLLMGSSWVFEWFGVRLLDLIQSRINSRHFGGGEHQSYHQLEGIICIKDELCCGREGEFQDGVHQYVG